MWRELHPFVCASAQEAGIAQILPSLTANAALYLELVRLDDFADLEPLAKDRKRCRVNT